MHTSEHNNKEFCIIKEKQLCDQIAHKINNVGI